MPEFQRHAAITLPSSAQENICGYLIFAFQEMATKNRSHHQTRRPPIDRRAQETNKGIHTYRKAMTTHGYVSVTLWKAAAVKFHSDHPIARIYAGWG